jgi:NAD(P)-dependent dehydrogenase (short-subunit alcohol dehydrogenase family)
MSTIIITGASGNLGLAVVGRLSQEAHRIITLDRSLPENPDQGNKLIENFQIDLMDEEGAGAKVKQLIKDNPELDAAILLVGGFAMGGIDETGLSDIDKMISLNFNTAYNIVRPLLPYFLNRPGGGHFILVGARPVMHPEQGKGMIAYTLSKSLVFRLAEFINAEGKDKNVGATVVVPSIIDTEVNREAMPDADHSTWVPPERIADAIAYALSPSGRMTRDTVIKIYNNS